MDEEQVAIFTADGQPNGQAPRSVMRARGLWHAATFVLPRSLDGQSVYVHQRTSTKDVFPGMFDCWAGGVLGAGETVIEGARRELAEELGITQPEPSELFTFRFEPTNCHCHCFEVRTDGPITWQAEEVADGYWCTIERLREMLDDPRTPFVPDGRAAIERWLSAG